MNTILEIALLMLQTLLFIILPHILNFLIEIDYLKKISHLKQMNYDEKISYLRQINYGEKIYQLLEINNFKKVLFFKIILIMTALLVVIISMTMNIGSIDILQMVILFLALTMIMIQITIMIFMVNLIEIFREYERKPMASYVHVDNIRDNVRALFNAGGAEDIHII